MPARKIAKAKKTKAPDAAAPAARPSAPAVVLDRAERRLLIGKVTGDKMSKTIKVTVERFERHVKYGKYLKRYTVCYAHDEKEEASVGDLVEIRETRPLSRTKHWRFVRILTQGVASEPAPAAAGTVG